MTTQEEDLEFQVLAVTSVLKRFVCLKMLLGSRCHLHCLNEVPDQSYHGNWTTAFHYFEEDEIGF